MPHARMTIDGHTVLDHNIEHWQQRAPEQLAELIASTTTNGRPWFKAAMMPLTQAFIEGKDITIRIATRDHGWTLTVEHPPATTTGDAA